MIGRLTEALGSIQFSGPGAPVDHLAIAKSTASQGRNVARAWAGQQAQLLELLGGEHKDTIVDIGRTYGLVTPGTSLLVLESIDQYIEYGIEPPPSLPTLRQLFHETRRGRKAEQDGRREAQLATVRRLWRDRIEWWETDFVELRRKRKEEERIRRKLAAAEGPRPEAMPALQDDEPPPLMRGAPPPPMAMASPATMAVSLGSSAGESPRPDRLTVDLDGDVAVAEPAAEDDLGAAPTRAAIQIKAWSPDTPYLSAMRDADPTRVYDSYLESRREYAASPAFFLDCADYLLRKDQRVLGLRVLSNLVELALGDPALMRMYAWRLQQAGELDQAIETLERVLQQRDDEPQSHRDLALALELRWQASGDEADAIRAMELLYAVVLRPWERFPEIEIIALMELNRLIQLAGNAGIAPPDDIPRDLVRLLDLDVRISMSWDADLTDVDLHVFEPTGGHAYYGHNRTDIGGLVSRDFRDGYGPEEYVLRRAAAGDYTIKAHYYGSHQQTVTGACTVIVTVFTNYGRANEEKQVLTLRLDKPSDQVVVGRVNIEANEVDRRASDWQRRFRSLTKEMSVDEVIAVVGHPIELRGVDELLLVYKPAPGVVIHVTAAPRVVSVQQLMSGATLDMI